MKTETRDRELWRDGDWRCEWWTVSGQQEIRLFLGPYRVSVLPNGPGWICGSRSMFGAPPLTLIHRALR